MGDSALAISCAMHALQPAAVPQLSDRVHGTADADEGALPSEEEGDLGKVDQRL
jgi:hypothetical protein